MVFIKQDYCRAQIHSEEVEVELLLVQKVQEAGRGDTIGSADKSVCGNKVIERDAGAAVICMRETPETLSRSRFTLPQPLLLVFLCYLVSQREVGGACAQPTTLQRRQKSSSLAP